MKSDPYKFVGTTLANRYRIESLLGIGGMAVVYQARHLVTTRTVAIKILDFGIAKALTGTTSVSRQVGTLYYASPEQLTVGSGIDHRSDIYSLGVILYQMLAGDVPFDDDDSMEHIIYQKLSLPPPPLHERRQDLPEAVEEVVMKALARNPAQRYQKATDLARAFRRSIRLETGALVLECIDLAAGRRVADASVYLNGKFIGQTDGEGVWSQSDLPPRQYLIEVENPRHQTWRSTTHVGSREKVEVVSGETSFIELKLAPKASAIPKTAAIGAGAVLLIGALAVPRVRNSLFGEPHPQPTPEIGSAASPSVEPTPIPSTPTITPTITPAANPTTAPANEVRIALASTPTPKPTVAAGASPKPAAGPTPQIVRVDSFELMQHARDRQFPPWRTLLPAAPISSEVTVEVAIDENGNVTPGRASGRTPVLQRPDVLNAVKQAARNWKFAPFERDGRRVKVRGTITFPVNLQ